MAATTPCPLPPSTDPTRRGVADQPRRRSPETPPSPEPECLESARWARLADAFANGDTAAFETVRNFADSVLRSQRGYDLGADWEDCLQDAMLSLWNQLRRRPLDDARAFGGYVRTTTIRKLADRRRRKKHEAAHPDAIADDVDDYLWPATTAPTSSGALALKEALDRLPTRQREAVVGVYAVGHTYLEHAHAKGVPFGSLKRDLRRGLEALRAALDVAA